MVRPTVIRESDILQAAREVFLSRGFRATTAEVAARAGISEGSIFKRFRSKFELFRAAMGSLDHEPAFLEPLALGAGKGDLRANLVALGRQLTAHLREVVPLHLVAFSNPGPDGAPQHLRDTRPVPLRILEVMTGYFEAEMRAGRLARRDPEIVARTFLGAIHQYVVFDLLFRTESERPMPEETYLCGMVDTLFRGIEPESAPVAHRA